MNAPRKLNIGSGTDLRPGWINLDAAALPGVDVVHDLSSGTLPFADGEFDEILCQDVLEHLEYVPVLREIHRVLKPGGLLMVRVPHFTSRNNFVDPTHRRLFSVDTWEFFVEEDSGHLPHLRTTRAYYFDFRFAAIGSRTITFEHRRALFFNGMVARFVNASPARQTLYESCFLSRLFPAENILVTLRR